MKKIMISILASSLLFGAGVYAGSSLDQVKAYKNPFPISIDGQNTAFDHAPLLYNNVTYLPLAELSSKLGLNVHWNEKEKKVEIQKNALLSGASGTIVTANEGGSLTFFNLATQKKQELPLAGSVHNVQVAPDGKTVWATVVPSGDGNAHGHESKENAMPMAAHMKVMEGSDMSHHDHMMMHMQDQTMPMMMDEKGMAEHAAILGVPAEKMKEVHQKMMSEHSTEGMMSDEMIKQCAELLGVKVEQVKKLHESMLNNGHGHHATVQDANSHGQNGKLLVIDVDSTKVIKEIDVGAHPAHVVLTPNGKYVLVTDSEANQVSIFNAQSFQKIKDVSVGQMPHGTRTSTDGKWAYIANMGGSTVSVLDIEKGAEVKQIDVGKAPVQVGLSQDGKLLTATLNGENSLAIVDLANGSVKKVKVGNGPAQVYMDPADAFAYVANQGTAESPSDTVSKVDIQSGKEVYQVKTGAGAHGVTTSEDGKYVFVTNMFAHTITVLDGETGKVLINQEVGKTPNGITFIQ